MSQRISITPKVIKSLSDQQLTEVVYFVHREINARVQGEDQSLVDQSFKLESNPPSDALHMHKLLSKLSDMFKVVQTLAEATDDTDLEGVQDLSKDIIEWLNTM